MKSALTPLLLALPLGLVACGGAVDPDAEIRTATQALNSNDAGAAIDHFGKALAALEPGAAGYERATLGQVEARILLDPEAAKTQFLAYAEDHGQGLEASDYFNVGSKLSAAGALLEATTVLGEGHKRFPDDVKLDEALKLTREKAEQAGDESALKALEGLGYT